MNKLIYFVYFIIAAPIGIFFAWEFSQHIKYEDISYDSPNFAFSASMVGYYYYYVIATYFLSLLLIAYKIYKMAFGILLRVIFIHALWMAVIFVVSYFDIVPSAFSSRWVYDISIILLTMPLYLVPAFYFWREAGNKRQEINSKLN